MTFPKAKRPQLMEIPSLALSPVHSDAKLRIPFGNYWGKPKHFLESIWSVDVSNKDDSFRIITFRF
jgi:hypothetical protein